MNKLTWTEAFFRERFFCCFAVLFLFIFVCFGFGHTQRWSTRVVLVHFFCGFVFSHRPAVYWSALRDQTSYVLEVHIGCWGLNLGWSCTTQVLYLLYYCSGPLFVITALLSLFTTDLSRLSICSVLGDCMILNIPPFLLGSLTLWHRVVHSSLLLFVFPKYLVIYSLNFSHFYSHECSMPVTKGLSVLRL